MNIIIIQEPRLCVQGDRQLCSWCNQTKPVPGLQVCILRMITLIVFFGGGGYLGHATQKLSLKCPCSHNNYTALVKQIYLFDTALVMINT